MHQRYFSTIRKGKSVSSARWLTRQQNDHVVKQAKREGLRSRAAFKLRELNAVQVRGVDGDTYDTNNFYTYVAFVEI
jgi:hypothetical protein